MVHARDAALLSRCWRLDAAVVERDGLEGPPRAGAVDEHPFERSLAAAGDVLSDRASLSRQLTKQGWRKSDVVAATVPTKWTVS